MEHLQKWVDLITDGIPRLCLEEFSGQTYTLVFHGAEILVQPITHMHVDSGHKAQALPLAEAAGRFEWPWRLSCGSRACFLSRDQATFREPTFPTCRGQMWNPRRLSQDGSHSAGAALSPYKNRMMALFQ